MYININQTLDLESTINTISDNLLNLLKLDKSFTSNNNNNNHLRIKKYFASIFDCCLNDFNAVKTKLNSFFEMIGSYKEEDNLKEELIKVKF